MPSCSATGPAPSAGTTDARRAHSCPRGPPSPPQPRDAVLAGHLPPIASPDQGCSKQTGPQLPRAFRGGRLLGPRIVPSGQEVTHSGDQWPGPTGSNPRWGCARPVCVAAARGVHRPFPVWRGRGKPLRGRSRHPSPRTPRCLPVLRASWGCGPVRSKGLMLDPRPLGVLAGPRAQLCQSRGAPPSPTPVCGDRPAGTGAGPQGLCQGP